MLRTLLLALVALSALAPLSSAQAWNRRISDVRIVHPPGSPPGTWTLEGNVEVTANDNAPAPVDLSFDLEIELNGTQIDVQPISVLQWIPTPCNWTTCNWGYCSTYQINGTNYYVGECHQTFFGSGQSMCGCAVAIDVFGGPWSSYLNASDQVSARVVARPGSLPETETSDDVVVLPMANNPIGTPYCFGDGSLATACPCNNNGLPGRGCSNSVNPDGARLAATGWSQIDPATGSDSAVLHGSGMPATSTAIYLKGSASNPNGAVFGDGTRCVAGQLRRMRVRFNVGGASAFPIAGDPSLSTASQVTPGSGVTAYYQVYYRDPASYCTALTYNITNAVAIDW